ncbi:MAG: hydroxymethylglutaryl-CoA lyase [Pseudomonadota bacterium]|nr:hydroxymethylglutaryl-CoA lyase [Pseudomonadota bacterium]
MAYPKFVTIFEAGARDGLQNVKDVIVPTDVRVELIDRLTDCGIPKIEAGSFVSPKWVPQMADTAEVLSRIRRGKDVVYTVLTPNMKGYQQAAENNCEEVIIFAAATESFSQANTNCSIAESLERMKPVADAALAEGRAVRGVVSVVLGCPFEGEVEAERVAEVTRELWKMGCYEVCLGDTIGTGTPVKAQKLIEAVARDVPIEKIALHFHDTYGQSLANILAGLEMGVPTIDAAVAGLGGCPYSPGATGNVATEDVVFMLNGMGIETGVDLDALVDTGWWISEKIGRRPASRVAHAIMSKRKRAA